MSDTNLKRGQHITVPTNDYEERPKVGQRIPIEGGTATALMVRDDGVRVVVQTVEG